MIGEKYIGQLLLLCFSVFLGHNLIPHHHHSELIITHPGESCPIEHEDHQTSANQPAHCHAFNQVAFNKVESLGMQEDARKFITHTIAFIAADLHKPEASRTLLDIPLKINLPLTSWGGTSAARAPPQFS